MNLIARRFSIKLKNDDVTFAMTFIGSVRLSHLTTTDCIYCEKFLLHELGREEATLAVSHWPKLLQSQKSTF